MFAMIDIAMDLCALLAVQLGYGALRPGRLLLAEAVLAASTRLCARFGQPNALLQAAVYLLSASALVDARRPRQAAEAALCLMCAFAAGAGFAQLGGGRALSLAPLGILALLWVVRRRRNARCRWNVELYVEMDGACDRFPALIDTGNRLRDRRSGLPVLIVEAAAAPNFAAAAERLDPSEARVLPFGVLGSAGELRCFRPDRVELRAPGQAPRVAPACLVGAYPGRIPGPTRAIAPPEFADIAAPVHGLRRPVKIKTGRYRNGVF